MRQDLAKWYDNIITHPLRSPNRLLGIFYFASDFTPILR
jgi:hypothetical protein